MIQSFRDKETEKVFEGIRSRKLPHEIQTRALKKLIDIDKTTEVEELGLYPGNNLEMLKGDWQGYYSIRINKQWRICFRWSDTNVHDVTITDYH